MSDIYHQNYNGKPTVANSQEVYLGVSKYDRQLKMAAETGNTYISQTKVQLKFQRQIRGLRLCRGGK